MLGVKACAIMAGDSVFLETWIQVPEIRLFYFAFTVIVIYYRGKKKSQNGSTQNTYKNYISPVWENPSKPKALNVKFYM